MVCSVNVTFKYSHLGLYLSSLKNNKNMIKLGEMVEDLVSGFKGIATAKVEYLNGCTQYCVAGKSLEGKQGENVYFDYQQLKVIPGGIDINKQDTGGPSIYQPKH